MAQNRNYLRDAEAKTRAGNLAGAIADFNAFLRSAPRDPRVPAVRLRLGEVLLAAGRFEESARMLTRALEDDPNSTAALYRLAQVHSFEGRTDEAFAALDRLLAINPDHESGIARRAALLQYLGRPQDAAALIDAAWARGLENPNLAHAFAGIAHSVDRRAEAIDRITPYAMDRALAPNVRAEMNYALARLLDSEGDYDGAWACYARGNELTRPRLDPRRYEQALDETIATYTRDVIEKLEKATGSAERAVLIVGMPRSGTTLVEQILGAHPRIAAGGELVALPRAVESIPGARVGLFLPPPNRVRGNALSRANRSYLDALDAVSTGTDRVTDKMPTNFQYLGLAPALTPGARVIHCTRDPVDTCLSCYFRNFVNLHPMLTDLGWIGVYYRCYARLMDHWRAELAGLVEMIDAPYDRAVSDFEAEARRLVEFVGLPFDDACLRFDEQRRMAPTLEPDQAGRKVYTTSLGRWRRYQKHLGPLLDALGPEHAPKD